MPNRLLTDPKPQADSTRRRRVRRLGRGCTHPDRACGSGPSGGRVRSSRAEVHAEPLPQLHQRRACLAEGHQLVHLRRAQKGLSHPNSGTVITSGQDQGPEPRGQSEGVGRCRPPKALSLQPPRHLPAGDERAAPFAWAMRLRHGSDGCLGAVALQRWSCCAFRTVPRLCVSRITTPAMIKCVRTVPAV